MSFSYILIILGISNENLRIGKDQIPPYKGCRQKQTNSIFTDIIKIEVDPPSSHPIFDKVLIILTSLPPLEFLTKIVKS